MKDRLSDLHAAASDPTADPANVFALFQQNAGTLRALFFPEEPFSPTDSPSDTDRIVSLLMHFLPPEAIRAADISVAVVPGHLPAIAAGPRVLFDETTHADSLPDPDEKELYMELECLWGENSSDPAFCETFLKALTAALTDLGASSIRHPQ